MFIKEPDHVLKCCICLELARDPKQEEGCGKLFCSDCIEEWDEACPHCRAEDPRYFNDRRIFFLNFFFRPFGLNIYDILVRSS